MILRRALKECGFVEFVEAADGREGLALLDAGPTPEVAFVDWYMPVMSGIDFVHAVRADHLYDAMSLVMVTSETASLHVDQALAAGVNEYVMKPFTSEVLADKLNLVLSSRG
jgi:two-component system chemotaxis response regulator CheY